MHETLKELSADLTVLIDALQSEIPEDSSFDTSHGDHRVPCTSKAELIEEVQSIVDFIDDHDVDDLGAADERIRDYDHRIEFLRSSMVPNLWNDPSGTLPAFLLTIDSLRKALAPLAGKDDAVETGKRLNVLKRQLRGMEAQLEQVEPRTTRLVDMVGRIEQAHETADRLPTELAELAQARKDVGDMVEAVTDGHNRTLEARQAAEASEPILERIIREAERTLAKCETAYAAATSVGLAAAFGQRSRQLNMSMWLWVFGLAGALIAGGVLGSMQLEALSTSIGTSGAFGPKVVVNILLSVLSVGASVWFAWLSTKQIGQRFRLSEDYGFKASIATAYEGYRREAARIDKDLEVELLRSALAHLDELPLRLVEAESHGSPWHELASSEVVKKAIEQVPGFVDRLKGVADREWRKHKLSPKAPRNDREEQGG